MALYSYECTLTDNVQDKEVKPTNKQEIHVTLSV